MRKITGPDAGQLYAMKVLKKATLKGTNRETLTVKMEIYFGPLLKDKSIFSLWQQKSNGKTQTNNDFNS